MNLYLISQDTNNNYDTYDSAVVAAETEEKARGTHPSRQNWDGKTSNFDDWVSVDKVIVKLIGIAQTDKAGVICASFNAG
jgi:hypothetical protein